MNDRGRFLAPPFLHCRCSLGSGPSWYEDPDSTVLIFAKKFNPAFGTSPADNQTGQNEHLSNAIDPGRVRMGFRIAPTPLVSTFDPTGRGVVSLSTRELFYKNRTGHHNCLTIRE